MMQGISTLLKTRNMQYDASEHRISCMPHVINICVQHILKSVGGAAQDPDDSDDEEEDGKPEEDNESEDDDFEVVPDPSRWGSQTYDQAAAGNPLKRLRTLIRTIRSSGQRRRAFQRCIAVGNAEGHFPNPEGDGMLSLPELELLRDVSTRWDSSYRMIDRSRALRPVSLSLLLICHHASLLTQILLTGN